jgi:hypothetical protein
VPSSTEPGHARAAGDGCRQTLTLEVTGPAARLFGALFGLRIQSALRRENAGFQRAAQDSSRIRDERT